ncbi:hypothetical protein MLD38_018487 [Melastoma candidum]|uniref:Uncharacterized protein n=1 Tax=Melastoma candidum TaxID=119954 RepID=A0ACB9QVW5_9MYRT|nr:hypothetical protein MLD38_018487 [Melastoma candidum]
MMKVVLKAYDLNNPKSSSRAMKAVSSLEGVESIKVDREKKTLTVIGNIDPYEVVCKLRKLMDAAIESAGPNKEENKEAVEKKKKEEEEKRRWN